MVRALWSIRNLSKNTQMIYSKNLRRIAKVTDLNSPERVEAFVFGLEVTNKYRNALFDSYSHYCKANEIHWDRPRVKTEAYPVKVPTEENIDKVIACASLKYATVFHLSKHGLRPDEISKITLRDIDLSSGVLSVRTSKMGLERTLKLKPEAFDLLKDYVNRSQVSILNEKLFASSKVIADSWRASRKKAFQRARVTSQMTRARALKEYAHEYPLFRYGLILYYERCLNHIRRLREVLQIGASLSNQRLS